MSDTLPDAHFGTADSSLPDWRKNKDAESPDDDEELVPTPPDVVEILGFDPAEEEDDG